MLSKLKEVISVTGEGEDKLVTEAVSDEEGAPCNTENPAKWLFVTPYKSTFNQLVEEVVVTATL